MKPIFILCFLIISLSGLNAFGQVGIDYDIKKPEKYENRKLGYEKTTETKFKVPRHFIQNTVTHYNYFFNANNKLNEVLNRAKAQNRDDFSKLLSFYNYSLDVTITSKRDLDSIIDKCNTAILIHDLRNDWVDNLYMLMGKAFFFRKEMDSAYLTFQFLNYAFAPKEEDGYAKPIASNANAEEGGNNFIVSTNEKRNIVKRTFSLPPSRNESLIWQIHTFIAKGELVKAGVLIDVLKHDPQFPARLQPSLEEMQALWYYSQSRFDSAAVHLEKALSNAGNRLEQARWEYLIGQLYDKAGDAGRSHAFFEKVIQHTYDPVMEVYARLNAIRQNKGLGQGDDYIQNNINALNKLSRKEIYADYRDIIYYTAAQMELQRKNKPGAINYLEKSVKAALPNSAQKNKSFLQLGDLAFEDKKYKVAKNYYDSVNATDPAAVEDPNMFMDRKRALDKIVVQLNIIDRQDSLMRIAAMPLNERTAYLKKMIKALRKKQGLSEDESFSSQNGPVGNNSSGVQDLFSSNGSSTDWYFNNSSLKSKGFNDFRSKWGNRPNVDNWQVASMASRQGLSMIKAGNGQASAMDIDPNKQPAAANVISYDSLLSNLPLTPEKYQKCLDSVEKAYFALGKAYQDGLPDYYSAISSYDTVLEKFPSSGLREETLFGLYFCYKKIGDETNAAKVLGLLKQIYPKGKYLPMITDPGSVNHVENVLKTDATRKYETIYNDFIEGDFEHAVDEKKIADSLYGQKYWTPQLLYIESLYFIHAHKDAEATLELNNITKKYAGTPMAAKAKNILSVLVRRKQIEDYLTNLKIVRATDDSTALANNQATQAESTAAPDSASMARAKIQGMQKAAETAKNSNDILGLAKITGDPTKLKIQVDSAKLSMLQKQSDSIDRAMIKAKKDAAATALLKHQSDSIRAVMNKLKADSTLASAERIAALKTAFTYTPDLAHTVMLVLSKVDPVYVTEAGNAFNRYNKESYYSQQLTVGNTALDDTSRLVLIRGFDKAATAIEYVEKARKLAPSEILPWLPVGKYSFYIITDQNLQTLQANKDMINYKKFLSVYFPGKF